MTAAPGQTLPPTAATPAYLRIRNLSKRFGTFTALRDVSLDIHEGEFVCFLGPSGCGKTTLLRAIAGLDIQSEGTIEQAGRDISRLPVDQRDFGIVFQSYALFPNLTVARNVGYGLQSQGRSRREIDQRVDELLALVGLPAERDKYPAQLSGGQQQRVALVRALATSPGLLLLDEPLSALDARVRQHLRREIRQLQRRLGVTTIMVTHDQEEALTIADRIVVMDHGVIDQVGTPMEVYREPATPFVAQFVGTMNFFPGEIINGDRVRVGGLDLRCDRIDGTPVGTEVQVCLRPEDVAVRNLRDETPNRTLMAVEAIEFLGSFCRATLASAEIGGPPLIGEFSINAVREMGIEAGGSLTVALPPERLLLFRTPTPER